MRNCKFVIEIYIRNDKIEIVMLNNKSEIETVII